MKKEVGWLLKEKYNNKPTKQFNKDVERLKRGEPLDYVIGFTEFLGCKIDLSKKPLIPRPETEFWVERMIMQASSSRLPAPKVLDMFAGSGCVGVAVLKNIKNSYIVFAEKDEKLLEQIKINIQKNFPLNNSDELSSGQRGERFEVIQSDIFSNVEGEFDFILANPPYIPTTRKNKIQKSVLKYEPKSALFGGEDGLRYIRKFLAEAKNFLNPGGSLYMEFDPIQKKEIEKILKKFGYQDVGFIKDQYGRWRCLIIKNIV